MKGSKKLNILLISIVTLIVLRFVLTFDWIDWWNSLTQDSKGFIISMWLIWEITAIAVALVVIEEKFLSSCSWAKWFSITNWVMFGIYSLYKLVVNLFDKYLSD